MQSTNGYIIVNQVQFNAEDIALATGSIFRLPVWYTGEMCQSETNLVHGLWIGKKIYFDRFKALKIEDEKYAVHYKEIIACD